MSGEENRTVHKTLQLKLTTIMMTTPFSIQAQAAEDGRGRWWLWLVLLLALSVVVAWLLGREAGRQEALTATARPGPEPAGEPATPSAPTARLGTASTALTSESAPLAEPELPASESSLAPASTPAAAEPDDLTQIEGIGPKISSVLQAAGIVTFADLANADTAHLKQILVDAGLRIHNPSTWPEQAALARAGRWEDLKAFNSQLNAGRRN
jgi:predicted flap endonuclease-1-like 5' DNA nuclease